MTNKRGHYAKGLARKDAIFQEVLALFSSVGHQGTSLRGIARELGISSGLIHHYFPSREDLLIQVVTEWDRRNDELADEQGLDALEGLLQSMSSNVDVPGLVLLYSSLVIESSQPEHPSRTFISDRYQRITQNLITSLEERMGDGRAPTNMDPVDTARILIAAIEGLQFRWLHDDNIQIEGEFRTLLKQLGIVV